MIMVSVNRIVTYKKDAFFKNALRLGFWNECYTYTTNPVPHRYWVCCITLNIFPSKIRIGEPRSRDIHNSMALLIEYERY